MLLVLEEFRNPEPGVGRKARKLWVKLPEGEGASLWGDILNSIGVGIAGVSRQECSEWMPGG